MPFCSFSKDFTESSFTSVENKFITKYLPEANGDAVRVYLYGLYLCSTQQDLDAENAAKLLSMSVEQLADFFAFWDECGLVQVLSRNPLLIEYLPVSSAIGKPKPFRPEKYAHFNRELFGILQRVEKYLKPYEQQKILEFLENNPMEQEAFLLVVEYYAKKDGKKITVAHILNGAAALVRDRKYTYEQVETEYSDFNAYTDILATLFPKLGLLRKTREDDTAYLAKWLGAGMEVGAIYACADSMTRGSMPSLDELICELLEKDIKTKSETQEYLQRRNELYLVVRTVAKHLNVKLEQPRYYIETYAEKWTERGYDDENLPTVAALCHSLGYKFPEMDTLLDELYQKGIVDSDSVREYCEQQNSQLRIIQSIQKICGVVKKTQASLDMISTWRNWSFSDEMILEAAKRSANAAAPLPYMNKLLSEWKRLGVYAVSEIPEKEVAPRNNPYKSEAAIAADERSARERFYNTRLQQVMRRVERAQAMAEKDEAFKAAEIEIKKAEIDLAKAEIFSPEQLPEIKSRLEKARAKRQAALKQLHLSDRDFQPKYFCPKCLDSGYLPNGLPCDCYKQ